MSYREIRNLTEHFKALGFPRTISLENFNTPNFPLLAEIIVWAMKMVDGDTEVTSIVDTEHDRVLLIRVSSIFFYKKLGVRLNTVKLYGADKLAARELLKISTSLYRATQTALQPLNDDSQEELLQDNLPITISAKDLRNVRQLASGIVLDAASLHDSLNCEVDSKMKREATLNQCFDVDKLEATLVAALHALSGTIEDIKEVTEQMEKQEVEIEEKIQKKNESLVRNRRRLEALHRIKPSWQSDFEEMELKLRTTWEEYITKHKNLSYLEEQVEELEKQQQEQLSAALQKSVVAAVSNADATESKKEHQLIRNRRVFGSMTGENIDTSDESTSTDSFLNDSASDEDSLTFLSKENDVIQTPASIPPKAEESLSKYALYQKTYSASNIASHGRPSSARPKSAHIESRVSALNNLTNSVKGSERVSPLSASEDNSDGF